MIALSVNLNKVALLRNSRQGHRPDVLRAARVAVAAGAQGITVHPRPDRRHIRPGDVSALAELLAREFPSIELNIEGNPFAGPRGDGYPGFMALIAAAGPAQATLVPDDDAQLTSDHGWDVRGREDEVRAVVDACHAAGARVSLFMDADETLIDGAVAVGADRIELYTGPFAETVNEHGIESQEATRSLARYRAAARHAAAQGLGVNAGHDLDLGNLPLFARIGEIAEVSIGHALIADALDMGLDTAVRRYLDALRTREPTT